MIIVDACHCVAQDGKQRLRERPHEPVTQEDENKEKEQWCTSEIHCQQDSHGYDFGVSQFSMGLNNVLTYF
eukprot:6483154-Amphidinium_carterae.1